MTSSEAVGITPFVLPPQGDSDEQQYGSAVVGAQPLHRATSVTSTASVGTIESFGSADSSTPLNRDAARR